MLKFSIIIPVYNVELYLKKCLDSVVNQSYSKFEVIIVCDDCSDGSEKIVDDYVNQNKNFIKIKAKNTGLAKARNIGLAKVKGDYILFLDSDDYFEKDLLETLNEELDEKLEMLRFQVRDINKNLKIDYNEIGFDVTDGVEAFKLLSRYHYIENSWAYVYKTSFWKENNFRFMDGCIGEDYGLTPLVVARAKYIKSIPYIGYNYVQRENSLMTSTNYSKKIKKMEDLLMQADFIKNELNGMDDIDSIICFLNNSLIYYSSTLRKQDYNKYNKVLKEKNCFDHLKPKNFKQSVKYFLIKNNAWFFYHFMVR